MVDPLFCQYLCPRTKCYYNNIYTDRERNWLLSRHLWIGSYLKAHTHHKVYIVTKLRQ